MAYIWCSLVVAVATFDDIVINISYIMCKHSESPGMMRVGTITVLVDASMRNEPIVV